MPLEKIWLRHTNSKEFLWRGWMTYKSKPDDIEYIRADKVKQLVEALKFYPLSLKQFANGLVEATKDTPGVSKAHRSMVMNQVAQNLLRMSDDVQKALAEYHKE